MWCWTQEMSSFPMFISDCETTPQLYTHYIFNFIILRGSFCSQLFATALLGVAPAAMVNACRLLFSELMALLRASTVFHQVGIHMVTSCKDIPHVRLHFLNQALSTNNIIPWEPMWFLMWFSMIILICLVTDWDNELASMPFCVKFRSGSTWHSQCSSICCCFDAHACTSSLYFNKTISIFIPEFLKSLNL